MEFWLLALRLMLAATFAVAGGAKLLDLAGSRKAMADFGVPGAVAGPLGNLLPVVELTVAGLLLPPGTAYWGGLAALVLLGAFLVAMAANLARGRAPECRCFGQVSASPIGPPTLVRNAILAAAAAAVAWFAAAGRAPGISEAFRGSTGTSLVWPAVATAFAAALAIQTWLMVHLFRQHGRLLLRMDAIEERVGVEALGGPPLESPPDGLPIGAPAPAFELRSLTGTSVGLDALWADGKAAMLVFADPDCGHCATLLPEIARWQREGTNGTRIAVIASGAEQLIRHRAEEYGLRDVLLEVGTEIAPAYGINATPAALVVQPDGVVGSRIALGADAIMELLSRMTQSPESARRIERDSLEAQPIGVK